MLRNFLLSFFQLFLCQTLSAAPKELGFDVNDVSILFPLNSQDQPVPSIGLNEGNDGGLISASVFSDLLTTATEEWISAPTGASIMRRDDWRIVSFRYDPCAAGDSIRDQTCVEEFRLVAQAQGSFGPADSAIHLVYRGGNASSSRTNILLDDLLLLKRQSEKLSGSSTRGLPLGVHPILSNAVSQGKSEIPKLFKNFVLKHALSSKLYKLTMMGLRDGNAVDWKFLGGKVSLNRWIASTIPNLSKQESISIELNLSGGAEVFAPLSKDSSLSTEAFFNSNPKGIESSMLDLNQAVHRLENPALTNRNSVDCVSCHTATSVRLDRNFPFAESLPNLTAKVPFRITGFPAPQVLGAHPTHWNLRAFGYFGNAATVSMRTVHESAQTAERLNKILGFNAPGRDCSKVESAVMKCFVDSSRLFGTVLPLETCLSKCQL